MSHTIYLLFANAQTGPYVTALFAAFCVITLALGVARYRA